MKTHIIYFLFFCLVPSLGIAQSKEMDTVYRPRTYHLIAEQYKSYPDSKEDVIFLGNSLTAYTNWNELLAMPQAKNRGISGDTSFGILERLDEIIEGKPAMVFLLIGINDISRNVPDSLILRNHQKIITRLKKGSPKTMIFLQTLLPVNNTFTRYKRHYNKDEHIAAVNKGLKKLAAKEEITLIDLHPHFLDKEGRLDKAYTEEGLHLNAAGYRNWAKVLKPFL